MNFTFYVVDGSKMPPASAEGSETATPEAIYQAIRENGGRWDQTAADVEPFAACFQVLDQVVGSEDFLTDMAFVGSPNLVLAGQPGDWALGYFEASLVHNLHAVIKQLEAEIEDLMDAKGEECRSIFEAFRDALEEAHSLGFSVAIFHDG